MKCRLFRLLKWVLMYLSFNIFINYNGILCQLNLRHYYLKALNTVATLPFHLVNDLWRWKIFRNETTKKSWNALFWKLKEEYLGVKAPVKRSKHDLDPPTLFHISNNYDMIR